MKVFFSQQLELSFRKHEQKYFPVSFWYIHVHIYKVYKINISKVKTTALKITNSRGFKKPFSFIMLKIHWLF